MQMHSAISIYDDLFATEILNNATFKISIANVLQIFLGCNCFIAMQEAREQGLGGRLQSALFVPCPTVRTPNKPAPAVKI